MPKRGIWKEAVSSQQGVNTDAGRFNAPTAFEETQTLSRTTVFQYKTKLCSLFIPKMQEKKGGKTFVSLDDFQAFFDNNSGRLPDNRPGR